MSPDDLGELQALLEASQVSTASLATESATTAPATTYTVTSEGLRRYGLQTLAEAINFLGLGANTEKRIDYSEFGARGAFFPGDYGAHVLVLIDGHAQNEQWDGGAYFDHQMGIPLELVDHVEIILGPGSVLYGSNAMLGVINVVTKNGRTIDGGQATIELNRGPGVRASLIAGRQVTVGAQRADLALGAQVYSAVGPALTLGPQDYGIDSVTEEPRRFTDSDVGTGVWGGTIREGRFTEAVGMHGALTVGDLSVAVRGSSAQRGTPVSVYGNFDDPDNWERDRWATGQVRWQKTLSRRLAVDARLYGDQYEYFQQLSTRAAENCLEGQEDGCTYELLGAARWGGLDARATVDWLPSGAVTTLVGADARARQIWSWEDYLTYGTNERVETDEYKLGERAIGVYAEQKMRAGELLALNLGARFDVDSRFGSHLSPRAAIALTPGDATTIKAVYSEAFRAPTAFERYYGDPTWWLLAEDLRAEVVRSVEFSVDRTFGDQRVLVGAYGTQWLDMVGEETLTEDEIAQAIADGELLDGVDWAYQYRNLGAARNYGVNVAFSGVAADRRVRYGATLTVADFVGKSDEGYVGPGDFGVAPKLFGNAHVDVSLGDKLPVIALATRWVGPRWIDYSEFEPYPAAPAKLDARLTLSGEVPGVEGLAWRLSGGAMTSTETPYSVGPLWAPAEGYDAQETYPVDRYTALAGLSYTF